MKKLRLLILSFIILLAGCSPILLDQVYDSAGLKITVEDVFYSRDSSGIKIVDSSTGANIIVAKIKFDNKSGSSKYISPSHIALINGSTQFDCKFYYSQQYTPEIVAFKANENKNISNNVIHTIYFVFESSNALLSNDYKIVGAGIDYDFSVIFTLSDIR